MSKFILFIDGVIHSRYDSEIHGSAIPVDAIEVSNELFFQTIAEADGIWTKTGNGIEKLPFPPVSIQEQISNRLSQIKTQCEAAISQISAGYPSSEVLSWPKQETEARAWLANNTAATPLVDALAAAREVPKADLVDRIIQKADLFAQVSGQLIGQRQLLEDQLDALLARHEDPQNTVPVTQEEIEAIAWPA